MENVNNSNEVNENIQTIVELQEIIAETQQSLEDAYTKLHAAGKKTFEHNGQWYQLASRNGAFQLRRLKGPPKGNPHGRPLKAGSPKATIAALQAELEALKAKIEGETVTESE